MMQDFLRTKIIDLSGLTEAVRAARRAGKVVVQCHGCFDIVHAGHIRYLEYAKRQGNLLIVSLTGDAAIPQTGAGPYIPQAHRAEQLAALMVVDYVYINEAPTAEAVLSAIAPDLYVKGREYEHTTDPAFLAEKSVVEGYGGRIVFSSGEIVLSSTDLLGRMPTSPETESHRLRQLCRRHDLTHRSLEETLARFRDLHVIVVGDVVIDRYVQCDAIGVASESPMMSLVHRDERCFVGGAAIVARHIAAMGAHAFLLSAGAHDEASRMVSDVLAAENVACHLMNTRPALVEKTRFLADETKLFKVDRALHHPLDSVAERQAALILEQQAKVADAVIFCDFGYGMVTGGLLSRTLPTLRQNVPILTADVSGGRANLLDFRHVDLLCPTEREVRTMLNDFESGLSAAAWRVLEKTQARQMFVTLDKRGMIVFDRPTQDRHSPEWSGRLKSEQLPSLAEQSVDRLGCGDALLAASTMALAAGAELMKAAYIGNAAAAIELSTLGNMPIEAEAMRRWLQARRELTASPSTRPTSPTTAPAVPDRDSILNTI